VQTRNSVTAATATACAPPTPCMFPFSPQLLSLGGHEKVEAVVFRGRLKNFDEKPTTFVIEKFRSQLLVTPTADAQCIGEAKGVENVFSKRSQHEGIVVDFARAFRSVMMAQGTGNPVKITTTKRFVVRCDYCRPMCSRNNNDDCQAARTDLERLKSLFALFLLKLVDCASCLLLNKP